MTKGTRGHDGDIGGHVPGQRGDKTGDPPLKGGPVVHCPLFEGRKERVCWPAFTRRPLVLPTLAGPYHLSCTQLNRLQFFALALCFAVSAPDVPPV